MIRIFAVAAICLLTVVMVPPTAVAEPSAATALCDDGTYWYGHERAGACDGHGGIDQWFG